MLLQVSYHLFVCSNILKAVANRRRKLKPEVIQKVKIDLKAGLTPRTIYHQSVSQAENPLDTSCVPSKEQIKYLNSKVQKELYPFEEVLN